MIRSPLTQLVRKRNILAKCFKTDVNRLEINYFLFFIVALLFLFICSTLRFKIQGKIMKSDCDLSYASRSAAKIREGLYGYNAMSV